MDRSSVLVITITPPAKVMGNTEVFINYPVDGPVMSEALPVHGSGQAGYCTSGKQHLLWIKLKAAKGVIEQVLRPPLEVRYSFLPR